MFSVIPCTVGNGMSFGHCGSGINDGPNGYYYDNLLPAWSDVGPPSYDGGTLPYCTSPFPTTTALTPASLPDDTFAVSKPSTVLSHHSNEYHGRILSDSVARRGLGISGIFSNDFSQPLAPGSSLVPVDFGYRSNEDVHSPQLSRAKRPRRDSKKDATPSRHTPITILPHPEGLQRLEEERHQLQVKSQQQQQQHQHNRSRAPGRGRRDPQAEEEDMFVENLREQNLAWKIIRDRFRERFQKDASEARLQMRMLRRRKERSAHWTESDIQILLTARDQWGQEKYRFVAQKMKELGAGRDYTAEQCEYQLQLLEAPEIRQAQTPLPPERSPEIQTQTRRKRIRQT